MTGYSRIKSWVGRVKGFTSAGRSGREGIDLERYLCTVEEYYQAMRALEEHDVRIRSNPEDALAYRDRGLAYALLGKKEQARHDLKRAVYLGIDPRMMKKELKVIRKMALDTSGLR